MTVVLDHLKVAEDALSALRAALERLESEAPPVLAPPQSQPVPAPERAPAPPAPGGAALRGLKDAAAFFNALRGGKALGPVLTAGEVSGCEAILAACDGFPISWAAYCLATPIIETNGTMQPIKEFGGAAYFMRYDIAGPRPDKARELGNLTPGDGGKYCGRGYVQMTGKVNYARAGRELGIDFVNSPDLALDPLNAAKIMRLGMTEGWFTGKTLAAYLPAVADIHNFTNARRIINGQDRAVEIAAHALEFQAALQTGGWA